MWRALCISTAVGAGIFVASGAADRHLFAGNNIQDKSKVALQDDEAEADFKRAVLLFDEDQNSEALKILQNHEDRFTYDTPSGQKWVDLALKINVALYDSNQLTALYRYFPEAFKHDEKASLLVANAFIRQRRSESYSKLRENRKGDQEFDVEWMFLDVDFLLLDNRRQEAIEVLDSRKLTGDRETNRLVRLALLTVQNDPKAAWDYLNEAQAKDPDNIDVYTYRARLLESVGKNKLASAEYISALEAAPDNIFIKDSLADFYIRQGQYQRAIDLWRETFDYAILDTIRLKNLFWSRMISPPDQDRSKGMTPLGKNTDLSNYLSELPPGSFWNQKRFEKIPDAEHLLTAKQATFWLRLLDHLQNGREEAALRLLNDNPFVKESWSPSLEIALRQLLVYRLTGNPLSSDEVSTYLQGQNDAQENAFFSFLNALGEEPELLSREPELKELLSSDAVFPVALLSAGWVEAGLQLRDLSTLSPDLPDWVAVALAQAIYENRGYVEALHFMMMQPLSPQLSDLTGELLALAKNNPSFIVSLRKTASQSNEKGMKAAWLLSLIHLERGDPASAKQVIRAQPLLSDNLLGKEIAARIALSEGNVIEADRIYSEIESRSIEAKSFLARKAFEQKSWDRAIELTRQLLAIYPDNPLLRENLRKISQAALR